MMNTATNNEFYERQSIEEFLSEHEVVRELYVVVRQRSSWDSENGHVILSGREILGIFNRAYYICMRLTDGSGCSLTDVWSEVEKKWGETNEIIKAIVYALVRSLLHLNKRFVSFDEHMYLRLMRLSRSVIVNDASFSRVRTMYRNSLTQPLNFSGLSRKAPAVLQEEPTDPMQLLERAASDLKKAEERIKAQLAEKDQRIEELENALRLEKENGKANISTNTINNAINVHTIGKYACEHCKDDPTDVISTVLRALAMKALLACEDMKEINKVLDQIENARKLSHSFTYNYNKDSQVFNGPITDSNFK